MRHVTSGESTCSILAGLGSEFRDRKVLLACGGKALNGCSRYNPWDEGRKWSPTGASLEVVCRQVEESQLMILKLPRVAREILSYALPISEVPDGGPGKSEKRIARAGFAQCKLR